MTIDWEGEQLDRAAALADLLAGDGPASALDIVEALDELALALVPDVVVRPLAIREDIQ